MATVTIKAPNSSNNALPVDSGGTGATTAASARTNLDVYSKSEVTSAIAQSTAKYITINRTVTSYGNTWISYSNDGKRVYAFVPDSDSASYDYYVFYSKGEQRYFVHLQTGAGVNAPDGTVVKGKAYYFD